MNCSPTVRQYGILNNDNGTEGFHKERRGRGGKGRPTKISVAVEEDLLAEVQRLSAENDYLKNLHALVSERVRRENGHK